MSRLYAWKCDRNKGLFYHSAVQLSKFFFFLSFSHVAKSEYSSQKPGFRLNRERGGGGGRGEGGKGGRGSWHLSQLPTVNDSPALLHRVSACDAWRQIEADEPPPPAPKCQIGVQQRKEHREKAGEGQGYVQGSVSGGLGGSEVRLDVFTLTIADPRADVSVWTAETVFCFFAWLIPSPLTTTAVLSQVRHACYSSLRWGILPFFSLASRSRHL